MATPGNGVLVVGEVGIEGLRPISWEMLGAGRAMADALGEPLVGLLMGSDIDEAAAAFGRGTERILVADDAQLATLTTERGAAVLAAAIASVAPRIVLVPGTTAGRDYAPRVGARLGVGVIADCVGLAIEDGEMVATRSVLGGRVLTDVRLHGDGVRIATLRPASFSKLEPTDASAALEPLTVDLAADDLRVRVTETAPKVTGPAKLTQANTVVSGGRGLKEPDNFALVEELAEVLGGAVGATRAIVDAGWRPHQEQIGQTGVTVQPRLYLAVGVSGAIQHNVGMQGSDYIVAINRDPDAPIFKIASFGIVGDLFEVVPALIAELRAAKGG